MVRQIIIRSIKLVIDKQLRSKIQNSIKDSSELFLITLEINFGNYYDKFCQTNSKVQFIQNKQNIFNFKKQINIFAQQDDPGQFIIKFQFRSDPSIILIGHLQQIQQYENIHIKLYTEKKEYDCQVRLQSSIKIRQNVPFIVLKNITCQLRDYNPNDNKKYYLNILIGDRRYRNKSMNNMLYWQKPFKFYLERQDKIDCSLVDQKSQQQIKIRLNIDNFQLYNGFERVFIMNKLDIPRGCIQFYYENNNLRSIEQYEKLQRLNRDSENKILKLQIKQLKINLKNNDKQISIRIFSGMNYIYKKIDDDDINKWILINEYLYIECRQKKCNLMIYINNKIIGYGILLLNMIGYYERRMIIYEQQNKKQLGYIMIKIHSQKLLSKLIKIKDIKLYMNMNNINNIKQNLYISFNIKGYYIRTQIKLLQKQIINYQRLILLKYTNQQSIIIILSNYYGKQYGKIILPLIYFNSQEKQEIIDFQSEIKCILQFVYLKENIKVIKSQEKIISTIIPSNSIQQNSIHTKLISQKLPIILKPFQQLIKNHIQSYNQRKNIFKIKKNNSIEHKNQSSKYNPIYTSKIQIHKNNSILNRSLQKNQFHQPNLRINIDKKLSNIYKVTLPKIQPQIYDKLIDYQIFGKSSINTSISTKK